MLAQIEPGEAVRIALAVIGRACQDARMRTPAQRDPARYWLRSGEAAELLTLCGKRITQPDIDRYLEGIDTKCPKI